MLSELLRTGQMNHLGRLPEGVSEFVVDSSHRIALSEPDISELAQAKGANVAGIQIVLEKAGLKFDQIDKFYLAGGFASYLNVDSAKRIGLNPNLPDDTSYLILSNIEGFYILSNHEQEIQQAENKWP